MAAQERYSRVLQFDPTSGQVQFLWEVSQAIVDPASAGDYGNWESSGVITAPAGYLLTVQAHTLPDPNFVQGGQLILIKPGGYRDFLPIMTSP